MSVAPGGSVLRDIRAQRRLSGVRQAAARAVAIRRRLGRSSSLPGASWMHVLRDHLVSRSRRGEAVTLLLVLAQAWNI